MMKKHISLILLASMAVTLFTGCRETPDATAELQKDQEQMLQTAEQVAKLRGKSVAEILG